MQKTNLYAITFLLAFVSAWCQVFGYTIPWDHLRVKWAPFPLQGYYNIPLNTSVIMNNEYVKLKHHEEFPKVEIRCYPDDPRVCVFYDEGGKVAGLRTSFVIKDLARKTKKGKAFLPEMIYKKPFYSKSTFFNEEVYYRDVLFVNPEKLKTGGLKERKEAVGDGVYLKLDGKTWTSIPRKESEVESKTPFKEQLCFPGMGKHYFYDLTKDMKCENNQPVFLLYHKGELVGLGLQGFGADSPKKRAWFEKVPKIAVKMISPKSPKCLAQWVKDYGLLSLHIFFQAHPRLNCIL